MLASTMAPIPPGREDNWSKRSSTRDLKISNYFGLNQYAMTKM